MPIHDWTRVDDGTYHAFHSAWITHLSESLNAGLLPPSYYALPEQHVGRKIPDLLTLHQSDPDRLRNLPDPPSGGAVAVADAPPQVSRTLVLEPSLKGRRRTLTIRHTSGHRIVALVEILSPGNKSTSRAVREFIDKVEQAVRARIHVVMVDLFPPGRRDPKGMHGELMEALTGYEDDELDLTKPLTFASYCAESPPIAYLEQSAVGEDVPDVPLFLSATHYIPLPLRATYVAAFHGMPAFWREVIEGTREAPQ